MFNKFSRFEEQFAQWRGDGYLGVKPETYKYIDFLSDPADYQAPRPDRTRRNCHSERQRRISWTAPRATAIDPPLKSEISNTPSPPSHPSTP